VKKVNEIDENDFKNEEENKNDEHDYEHEEEEIENEKDEYENEEEEEKENVATEEHNVDCRKIDPRDSAIMILLEKMSAIERELRVGGNPHSPPFFVL
jgi:hypothetical protein